MFRRLRHFIGTLNAKGGGGANAKRLLAVRPKQVQVEPAMLETVQEIAVYIHRFHNLDLFQQGWYQIKLSMRWEDGGRELPGTPARVVQYEVPELGSDEIFMVWRIDDVDHSFFTQPFRIKYVRQDVLLSVMISFNLAVGIDESSSSSSVILKFELLHAPISENESVLQAALDAFPAAVHELRVPPKALLGLHTYCPLHFDSYHAVLIELSIHVVRLKAGTNTNQKKVPSDSSLLGVVAGEHDHGKDGNYQVIDGVSYVGTKELAVIKALFASRATLLEELQKISKAIDQKIDDLADANLDFGTNMSISPRTRSYLKTSTSQKLEQSLGESNEHVGYGSNGMLLPSLSKEELVDAFQTLGNQLSVIWNAFLKFHRNNRIRIVEYLRGVWANDRRTEWAIWMVHSRMEVHKRMMNAVDDASPYAVRGKILAARKPSEDPSHVSISRAELHRKSIAQMKINSQAIQDLHIFGDPARIPIIFIEQTTIKSLEQNTVNGSSSFGNLDKNETSIIPILGHPLVPKSFSTCGRRNGRVLKAVVFVHGFQGHHLDLRLVRNQWLLIDPGAECLMSEVNEEKTSGDFQEMGGRLAEEVASFLRKKIDLGSRSGPYRVVKLSFVGHSIGNIIVRTALTDAAMQPYLKYLHTYMSISGPHLGYLYSSNSLFNSGLWLLKKLKGAHCMHQLTFTDDADIQKTFFYKLNKQKTLENFKNVILLSSPQDGYVPYHSARIEACYAATLDSKRGPIFMEMLNSCLDQIHAPSTERRTFVRCDVNFDTSSQGRNLNTMIGRAAHIEFLETDIFAKFIMWSFSEFFT
ncbi:protein FAM135B isoform X2 [Amborella trichopoda]|uniref:protein FAM135B isoform X2 n=1 Tax=Amborella trichopoda TaxID=13333 RepID=UPI0009BDB2C0|nr:protein FAM135B isoform X2 [Amborella trichopoda]|eukprot:XP_020527412.1 protein FAM135B isoform X2 [Amborella trichopoda]